MPRIVQGRMLRPLYFDGRQAAAVPDNRANVCPKPHLLLPAGRFLLRLLEFFQLFNQVAYLPAILALIRRHLRRGFRHDERVGAPVLG